MCSPRRRVMVKQYRCSPQNGPSGPRRECAVNSQAQWAENFRKGEFTSPEDFNLRRVERPKGAEPKKKDTTSVVSFFLQWSNGIDAERHTALLGRGASAP